MDKSILLTPGKIGPLTFRNRTIRATVFESVYPGNVPSEQLFNYHTSVVAGGIGMTNIARATVAQSGSSFERQLWMRSDTIPGLHELTDVTHKEGAAASIQLGYCGNMSYKRVYGCTSILASNGLNLYSPMIVRGMRQSKIASMAHTYGGTVRLARKVGMDAVEIHVGHGYLISQFLFPYTNHRKDEYGGSLESRIHLMRMCMEEVMKAAGSDTAVAVETNMRDGFKERFEINEYPEVARTFQDQCGARALVLSGGFVSRAPTHVIWGEVPIRTMAYCISRGYLLVGVRMVGKYMTPSELLKEAYFLEDALKFRKAPYLPPIYVGGLASRDKTEEIPNDGFEFVVTARVLVDEPSFVNHMREDEHVCCDCGYSDYRIARMYSEDMVCHKNAKGPPKCVVRGIKRLEYK